MYIGMNPDWVHNIITNKWENVEIEINLRIISKYLAITSSLFHLNLVAFFLVRRNLMKNSKLEK